MFAFSISASSSFGETPRFSSGRLKSSALCPGDNSGIAVGELSMSFVSFAEAGIGADCVCDLRGAPEILETAEGIRSPIVDELADIGAGALWSTAIVGCNCEEV